MGISAFLNGFYDATVWGPILLGVLAVLPAFLIARPSVPTGAGIAAIGGLLALWLWSLLSGTWTEAVDLAVTDANRWLLYAVILVLALYLADDAESRRWLIGATAAGVFFVAAYILIRFLTGEGPGLFLANRLDGPLGYINAVATYMLVGIWPLVALAERAKRPAIRGLGAFGAVQLLSIAVLTQSRGGVVALIATTAVLLIVVPGRLTRSWVLITILGGVAVAGPALLDVIGDETAPTADALRSVAVFSLIGGVVAGITWALVCTATDTLASRPESVRRPMRLASIAVVTLIAVAVTAVALSPPSQRLDQVRDQYDNFTSLAPDADGGSRLTSGGGYRYDYWRVAVEQLSDYPLKGVGAGNYTRTYFQERRTTEDVQQAHSIELQALGELGLVGGLFLASFVGAVLFGFWRTARGDARRSDPAMAVAAGGIFLVWLIQTSVDWMHLIPGLTGIAICAAAAMLPPLRALDRKIPLVAAIGVAVAVGLIAYPAANQVLAQRFQAKAEDEVRTNPVDAIDDARTSISLKPSQQAYYTESAAFARLGLYRPSRNALLEAAARVPHDFVAWGLLGDLATRRGLPAKARAYYRRASKLNPRDPGLKVLAKGRTE